MKVKQLIRKVESEKSVISREQAIKELALCRHRLVFPALVKIVRTDNDDALRTLALNIVSRRKCKGKLCVIVDSLTYYDYPMLQSQACQLTGSLKISKGLPRLIEILENSNKVCVIYHAIRALACLKAKEAVPSLIELAMSHSHQLVRVTATEVVGKLGVAKGDILLSSF